MSSTRAHRTSLQQTDKPSFSPQLQQLVRYLSNIWLHNIWTVHEWSIFRQTVKTNKEVEGWRRRFNAKASGTKLHFYKKIPALMKEAKSVNMTIRLVEEQVVQRCRRTTYKMSEGRLSTLWDQLEKKTINTSDFLKEVGTIYSVSVPEPNEEPIDSDVDSDSDSD